MLGTIIFIVLSIIVCLVVWTIINNVKGKTDLMLELIYLPGCLAIVMLIGPILGMGLQQFSAQIFADEIKDNTKIVVDEENIYGVTFEQKQTSKYNSSRYICYFDSNNNAVEKSVHEINIDFNNSSKYTVTKTTYSVQGIWGLLDCNNGYTTYTFNIPINEFNN